MKYLIVALLFPVAVFAAELKPKEITGYWQGNLGLSESSCTYGSTMALVTDILETVPVYLHIRASSKRNYAVANSGMRCSGAKLSKGRMRYSCVWPVRYDINTGDRFNSKGIITYTFLSKKTAKANYQYSTDFIDRLESCVDTYKGRAYKTAAR